MATTALRITEEGGVEKRLLFMTVPTPTGVDVDIYPADEEFNPVGTASLGVSQQPEDQYHTDLRKQASEKGHFVPEYSTNPEWNPGYKPEEHGDQGTV